MGHSSPSTELLELAIDVLTSHWQIPPSAAAVALIQVSDSLGLTIGDLAALVCASDHQQRASGLAPVRRLAVAGAASVAVAS